MIKPTIGRMVWYWPDGRKRPTTYQPLSAQIAFVHNDQIINIGYLDENGRAHNATGVWLAQDGGVEADESTPYCEWMPYQKGQAARTEAAEAKAAS
jgi:hypothetical protein